MTVVDQDLGFPGGEKFEVYGEGDAWKCLARALEEKGIFDVRKKDN